MSLRFPEMFQIYLNSIFAKILKIDLTEARFPSVSHYQSLQDLFIREINPSLRPIENDHLVFPCDGVLSAAAKVDDHQRVLQVKGIEYSLQNLFLRRKEEALFTYFSVIYLSPKHYHRVHYPVSGKVSSIHYVPGKLWPVNVWGLKNIPRLFEVNERLVITIDAEQGGQVSITLVGALNVGKIFCNLLPGFYSNSLRRNAFPIRWSRYFEAKDSPNVRIGAELGGFMLGSTVVMAMTEDFMQKHNSLTSFSSSKEVKFGQTFTI
jgi:phosphatidylserine decarboxylase